jgi:hypothetical protein
MIPISYWLTASDESLGNVALNRQNQAANLRKEIKAMQAEAETLEIEAGVALWLRDNRKEILEKTGKHLERIEDVRKRESAA